MHRHPFATDAYELGFAVGVREDYGYQIEELANVDLPVNILDNDFQDPDIGRYVDRFEKYDPSVGILGDAYTEAEAEELNQVARELRDEYPYKEFVVVPKCREALELFDSGQVLGYPIGYSDIQASDFSDPVDWRGRRVHLLGGSPPNQYDAIQELTQPVLTGDPPADIIGLDWNGLQKVAYKGEYWSRDGWQSADHLSIRETVRKGLNEVKAFWQGRGIWPDTEPRELYGSAVKVPDDPVYTVNGETIRTQGELEESIVVDYGDQFLAFQNSTEKRFVEYREGL